jgi:hypothetical protein
MKKMILLLLMIGVMMSLIGFKSVYSKENPMHNQATIIRANYQGNQLLFELEIEQVRYTGEFYQPVSYEDYLYLHHNVGTVIEVDYTLGNNQKIIIYSWQSQLK